jgi:predicted nucleotidyltransferase
LKPYSSKIQVAFVYGSVAKGTDTANSDIDLMIIGKDLSYSEVYSALQKAEKVLLRPVNPKLMDVGEWRSKLAHKNPFLTKIAQGRNLFIIGTKDELQASR